MTLPRVLVVPEYLGSNYLPATDQGSSEACVTPVTLPRFLLESNGTKPISCEA